MKNELSAHYIRGLLMSMLPEWNEAYAIPDSFWRERVLARKAIACDPRSNADDLFADYDKLWRRPQGDYPTGKERVIGMIDQSLCGHPGYRDRILSYETVGGVDDQISLKKENASYHGSAVASIAVDKNIGIAPDAQVVYRAYVSQPCPEMLLHNHYAALKSLLDYAKDGNRLDVISTSKGWGNRSVWEEKTNALIRVIETEWDIPVFNTIALMPFVLPCEPKGPFRYTKEEGLILFDTDLNQSETQGRIAVPIVGRPIACGHPGQEKHLKAAYFREPVEAAGLSWAVPFVAGLFADARERRNGADKDYPKIAKDEFIDLLRQTAQTITLRKHSFPAVDIKAFMEAVKRPGPIAPFDWKETEPVRTRRLTSAFLYPRPSLNKE